MELPGLGKACEVCKRNDYLPFKCQHCKMTVCIDHKTNHGADCPMHSTHFEIEARDGYSESLKAPCDYCKKITLKLELVECLHCKRNHCLYHRHQVQHKCIQIDERREALRKEAEEKAEKRRLALEKLKENCKASSSSPSPKVNVQKVLPTDPKKRELARRVNLMLIKQGARGPPNILNQDKVYFQVRFEHEPKSSLSIEDKHDNCLKLFTTSKHTLGRMIDWSADELQLVNKNHITGASQLIFKKQTDTGEFITLDSQSNFTEYLRSKELQSGDEIILTYTCDQEAEFEIS